MAKLAKWCAIAGGLWMTVTGVVSPALASVQPADGKTKSKVRLIAEQAGVAPGQTLTFGLHFEMSPGWHIYYAGINDTGMPPSAEFTLPEGWKVGQMQWPAPKRKTLPGDILDHIYEGKVALLVPVTVPADWKGSGQITITAAVDWLVCEDACLTASDTVKLELPVREASEASKPGPDAALFATARQTLPKPLPADGSVRAVLADDRLRLAGPEGAKLEYFPADGSRRPLNILKDCTGGRTLDIPLEKSERGEALPEVRGILRVAVPAEGGKPDVVAHYLIENVPAQGAVQPGPRRGGY